jgi:hypothetical protein
MSIHTQRARDSWERLDKHGYQFEVSNVLIQLIAAVEELEQRVSTITSLTATHRHGQRGGQWGELPIDARTGMTLERKLNDG